MQAINTLLDIVSPYFTSHKDAPAVRFDDGETILVSTYSQLQKSTDQVTAALHRMEVKDEIVGICISPSQNLPAVLLGVLGCGAAFYNFEPSCVNFARHVVREMGVRVVLVDQDHLQKVESLLLEFDAVVMRDLWMLDFGLILIHLRGQTQHKHAASLAYCITTSGTTGLPKTVRVPHQCIVPNITHLRGIFNIADHDLIFLSSPLTFDPSIVDIFLALGSGACLLIVPHVVKMKPKSLLRMLYCRHKVTYLQATPSLVSRIGPEMLEKTLLGRMSHLKTLAFGGEKFPSISLLMKWRGPGNSTKFFNLYGTTEVSCWSTCYEVTQKDFSSHTDNLPLGQPLTDTIAIVLGDNGQQVKEGRGQLFLGGLRRRQCYLAGEEPDQRPPVLRGTGDTVSINNKGEITFLHRTDDQVKRNGQRINLCEIEKVVTKQEAVGDCRVLFYQRKLIVFVLLKETKTKTDSQIVLLWIQTRLPSQYWPDHVVMVSEFPVTTHGKLDKKALLQKLCDEPTTKNDSVTPGRITVVLETIWKEVLRTACHTPDVDSNFITSGGDSLTAVQFSDKVESSLNIKLPRLLDLVLHNTYKDIITYIEMCVNRAKSPQQMCMEKSVDIDESALKKGGTGNVNSDNFDIVVSVLNDEKRQFDISSSAERKDFYRKRKYDDKSEEIDLADAENRCKESLTFGNETGYKMVCENTISSVGRGNRGIICPNLKGDLMRANCLVRSERSLSQTYECNINSEHTNIDETQGHDSNMTLEICWKVNTGKCVDASPVIARHRSGSNTVFIGSHSHKFFAINLETGELQWEITLGDRIESSACVSMCGQYVIVGCYDWSVYVVERLTGDIWWKYKTGAEVKSSPAVDPQTSLVYIGSHDKHLHALDIKARTCLFKTYLGGGSIFSSPSVSSTLHTVYVGTLSGALSAVNSRTGYILWTYDCKKPLFSSPCVSQDGLYIGCVDGSMYHLSLDGKLLIMERKPKLVVAIKVGYAFSGYAYSFHEDFTQNPLKIGTCSWHSSGRYTALKTSSAILCRPDGTFHSFGYSAEDHYISLGEEADRWFLFKTFPQYKEMDRTSTMNDSTGKKGLLAMDLFSMAMRYLRENLCEKLCARLNNLADEDISWAILTQYSYNETFIMEAATRAGMKQNVTVLTKMNAALTYLKCSSMFRGRAFKPGGKFLIVDAACMSVDLSTCDGDNGKVNATNRITVTTGGQILNKGIMSLIETVLGVEDLSAHDDVTSLMKEIEYKKRRIKPGSRETVVFQLPIRYKDAKPVNKRIAGKTIPGVLDDADFDGKVKIEDGKVHIDFEVIEGMFMACARDVISLLLDSLQRKLLEDVISIIMIGGYSSSAFLQNEVRRAFPKITVHTMFESDIADLKGAVIFGHSKGVLEIHDSARLSVEKIQHYIKTLQDRTEKARNIRIIIVGQEGVGKSTLCHRLLDEDDNVMEAISSTDGVDIFIQRFLIDMDTKKRIKLEANKETQNIKSRIQQVLLKNKIADNTEEHDFELAEVNTDLETTSEYQKITTETEDTVLKNEVHHETQSQLPKPKSPVAADDTTEKNTLLEAIGTNEDRYEHWANDLRGLIDVTDSTDDPNTNQAYLSLWDFGGEESYYSTHHIFLSSDAIFLVIYNLEECIEGTQEASDVAIKRIKYWIRSAVNCSEKRCKKNDHCSLATPPIILVGTRLDKLSGTDDEIEQKLGKFEEKLCGMADIQAIKSHIYGFLEVNNKVRNHVGIGQLWDAILEVAPSQSQWEKELPARWLALERELMRLKETGEKVMSFADVVALGRTCEVEVKDETEIHMFLKYLHYTGCILYFGEETESLDSILAKTVILDPQWIAQAFRKIITVPKFVGRKDKRANFLWKMYRQSATLDMEYLQIAWNQDKGMRFWKYKSVILAFMERLGLIVKPNQEEPATDYVQVGRGLDVLDRTTPEETYVVPSLLSGQLMSFPRKMTDRYAVRTRTLCLVFLNKGVPIQVYDILLAACIEKYHILKTEEEICLGRGFGIFSIDPVWSVVISCGRNIIKITLFKQTPIPNIEPGAGLRVRLFVEGALRDILEMYAHRDFRFTYHLHCKPTVSDRDVTLPKTEIDQRKLLPCCSSSKKDKHFIHKHELRPWFSEERPPIQDEYEEEYQLASEILDRCPTEVEMLGLSKVLGKEYFEFFILLGLGSTDISLINIQYQRETMIVKFLHMFSTWKKAEGSKATIRRIMDAMKTCGLDSSEVVRRGVFNTIVQEY